MSNQQPQQTEGNNECNAPPNNRFIPFYMRDDLPTNRQCKTRVKQRRRRKTVQDVLQQKGSNVSQLTSTASSTTTTPNRASSTTTTTTSHTPIQPAATSSSNGNNNNRMISTFGAPSPLYHHRNPNIVTQPQYPKFHKPLAPAVSSSSPTIQHGTPTTYNTYNTQHTVHHQPIHPQQHFSNPSQSFQTPNPPNHLPSIVPQSQQTIVPPSLQTRHPQQSFPPPIEENQSNPLQGIFPAQTFTEIATKFGGSIQYRQKKNSTTNSASTSLSDSGSQSDSSPSVMTSLLANRMVESVATERNVDVLGNLQHVPSVMVTTPTSSMASASSSQPPTTLIATSSTTSVTSSNTGTSQMPPKSAKQTSAIYKLKKLQQRSSDKDLHALNSSAQVLNYLKMVQQQQQAYMQQRMLLQSNSTPNLNISVNNIKNQLYNTPPIERHPSQELLLPSYQLNPTVDMMISNWENEIRQCQQRQRRQKLYGRPIPSLRLPPHTSWPDPSSGLMIDSSSSGSSSMGSDRSMSARFGSGRSTLSARGGVLGGSSSVPSPLNSPTTSSTCGMSDSGSTSANGRYYNVESNEIGHNGRPFMQLESPEDEDDNEDEDALMIDEGEETTILPSISKLNLPINLPPLNLMSVDSTSSDTSIPQQGHHSCPTTPHQGIQQLFVNNNSAAKVQPNQIPLSSGQSGHHYYRPEGFITHRSQHNPANFFDHQQNSLLGQLGNDHRQQQRVHIEGMVTHRSPLASPKRSPRTQYHPYPMTSPRAKKKKSQHEIGSESLPNLMNFDSGVVLSQPQRNTSPPDQEDDLQQRMSMQLFQAIFRHTPVPMFILNSRARFMSVNHAFISMLGYSTEDEFTNKNAFDFVSSERETYTLMENIKQCALEGSNPNQMMASSSNAQDSQQRKYTMTMRDISGSHITAEHTIYVLRDVMYGTGEFFVFTVTNHQLVGSSIE